MTGVQKPYTMWWKIRVNTLNVGFGKVGQPLRLAVTGHGKSPSIDVTLELLGKEKTISRLDQAISFIKN